MNMTIKKSTKETISINSYKSLKLSFIFSVPSLGESIFLISKMSQCCHYYLDLPQQCKGRKKLSLNCL